MSANGQFAFAVQTDGNVVIYRNSDAAALWSSGTYGTDPETLDMQQDGNLVLYGYPRPPDGFIGMGGPGAREALWSTDTWNKPGSWFVMQDDGNAVVYWPTFAAWASGTWQG